MNSLFFLFLFSMSFLSSCGGSSEDLNLKTDDKIIRNNNLLGNSELDPRSNPKQCLLLKGFRGYCSGTFIDKNLFLTAAHCLDFIDVFDSPQRALLYEIKCFNGFETRAKSLHIHPLYFKRKNYPISINESYYPENGTLSTNSYNDLAIIVTKEHFPSGAYPRILDLDQSSSLFINDSCASTSFSNKHCTWKTGKGCYRDTFSIVPAVEREEWLCNLYTGVNCQLDSSLNEQASEENPLMLSTINSKYSKGDSGGGIFCNTDDDVYLAGVYVQGSKVSTVALNIKNKFIKNFINKPIEQRSEYSPGMIVHPKYLEMIKQKHHFQFLTNKVLGRINKNKYKERLKFKAPEPLFYDQYFTVLDFIKDNNNQTINKFVKHQIARIEFVSYTSKKITLKDWWIDSSLRIIEIGPSSSSIEIIEFLNNL